MYKKTQKFLFCFWIFALCTCQAFAQKEGNIWYFGDHAGLDFNSGSPVSLNNGALFTYDNSSTISDSTGSLLFYTNGVTVWNKNHLVMNNGSSLLGNTSGGQSALIVPQPNSSIYYIFTTDCFAGSNGLRYTIVDMSLASGLGAVTSKNNLLFTPSTEKLDAVYNCADDSYWVITHQWNNNTFSCYKINSTGLVTTPVNTNIGTIHTGGTWGSFPHNAAGQMTLSHSGNKLAVGLYLSGYFELFDFDKNTGMISNFQQIDNYPAAWGIAFSPDDSKLYTTRWALSNITQFDLNAGSITAIKASATIVGTLPGGQWTGYLQSAPDQKIYLARFTSSYLGVINNPNLIGGACNFVANGINLNPKNSQAGLSRVVLPHYRIENGISANNFCINDSTYFSLTDTGNILGCVWNFGDTVSGLNNSSNQINPFHIFSDSGTFIISVIINYQCFQDTLYDTINIGASATAMFSNTISPCSYNVSFNNLSSGMVSCHWNFGDGTTDTILNPNHTYSTFGIYNVQLIINGLCSVDTTTLQINIASIDTLNSVFTYTQDTCDSLKIYPSILTNANSLFIDYGDGTTDTTITSLHIYNIPGQYTITLILSNTCFTDTISVPVNAVNTNLPQSNFIVSIDSCTQMVTFYNQSQNALNYVWNFGDGTTDTTFAPVHTYLISGNYQVQLFAINPCSIDSFAINISIPNIPQPVSAFNVSVDSCLSQIICTNISINSTQYLWMFGDGTTDTTFAPVHTYLIPGNYQVQLFAINSCSIDSLILNISIPDIPKPSASLTVSVDSCLMQLSCSNNSANAVYYLWNFGDGVTDTISNPVHVYLNSGNYVVTLIASNDCESDTVLMQILIPDYNNLQTNFTAIIDTCNLSVSFLNQSINATQFLWQFGDSTTSLIFNPSHQYAVAGSYLITLITANACKTDTLAQTINLQSNSAHADFSFMIDTCELAATFLNSSIGASTFLWDFGDNNYDGSSNPNHSYLHTGIYNISLIINPNTNCSDTTEKEITFDDGSNQYIFIPNVFTPNDDGLNDFFELSGNRNCADFNLKIYNRWGTLVFETDQPLDKFWDGNYNGNQVPEGVYVYLISGKEIHKGGAITLFR